jgi:hypothetical protein
MSEIDPWALPQGGAAATNAGIPGAAPYPVFQPIAPLSKTLPIVAMVFGALYVVACLIELFVCNHEVSFLNSIDIANVTQDQVAQAQSDDNTVKAVSLLAAIPFWGAIITVAIWERRLTRALGSVGARRAIMKRAGFQYFRALWLGSIVLSFLVGTGSNVASIQDAVSRGHELTIFYGVRAVLGVVLVYFAYRLKKISEEGVELLGGMSLGGAHL